MRALAGQAGLVALERGQPRPSAPDAQVVEAGARRSALSPPARFPDPWIFPAPRRPRFPRSSCVTRSRNCAFCPVRPKTRTSNNLLSLAITSPDIGIVGATIGQRRRKLDLVQAALLGFEPRGARPQTVEGLDHDRKARLDHGFIETHHDIAGLDERVTVTHPDLADHTAGSDAGPSYDIGIDHHRSRRDQRAGDHRAVEAQVPESPRRGLLSTTASPTIRCSRIERRAPRSSPVMIWLPHRTRS